MKIKDILTICHGRDYKSLNSGKVPVLGTGGIITFVNKYLCNWNCVLIGRKGTINKPQYMSEPFWCVDTLFYSKPKENNYPKFQFYLFETIDWNKNNEASGVPSLSASTIGNIKVKIPSLNEQIKISTFLTKIDERIETQSKIIKDIETLKKLICYQLFFNIPNKMQLSKLCSITTGKLDANQMDENGSYPFFTCGKETLKINTYAFDCEAILISGNGDIGHTKYYNGKFNAYQRTYVLYNFKSSPIFIKYAIDHVLPRKIKEEMQSSAMPYIKLSTLANLNIPYPEINIQNKIIDILNVFQKKLDLEISILEKFKEQKKYLLANMFI